MKKNYYILGIFIFCGLLFSANHVNAAVTIGDFNVNGAKNVTVKLGDSMTYNWRISATKADVTCGQTLSWSIERDSRVPDDRRVVASGTIDSDQFLISTTQTGSRQFSFTPLTGRTSEGIKLVVGCGREPGTNRILGPLAQSAPVTVNFTGQTPGRLNINFDASPKSVAPNTSVNFNFTIRLTAKQADLDCRLGASAPVKWSIYKFLAAGRQDDFISSNLVNEGALTVSSFGATSPTTEQIQVPKSILTPNQNFIFKAQVTCDRSLATDVLTTSGAVPITVSGTGSGGTAAVCGNDKCESGETQSSCPADCKPGETQTYPFEITNPLKGGADDFSELVKILAQWIFNLAIPIAVAMIVYSGILFLTAAGEPAKVTKAKEVLKYAVIGLAIILIGSGFVTLIQSVLELGGTNTPSSQSQPGSVNPESGGIVPGTNGAVGNKCSRDSNCSSGLKCKNTICTRPTGNNLGEPCNGGASCGVGLSCDKSGDAIQPIDGQTLGSCYQP